ncbi:unnamed protein product [Linum tenue]|uniref:Uncharacterized protein n=1 Tax=Linum tenue TaxID=586396 RepID=A0AAV0QZW0_9ROSI|nr:unnamed protein product [Linum tenue]
MMQSRLIQRLELYVEVSDDISRSQAWDLGSMFTAKAIWQRIVLLIRSRVGTNE